MKCPDTEFRSAAYGKECPDVTNRDVIIADFSYDRETLLKMKGEAKSLLVLDHHGTAQKALEGLDFCIFDMSKSGAGLVWDHYFGPMERPLIVDYVEDYDLWTKRLPHCEEVSSAILSREFNFEMWDELASRTLKELIAEGKAINRYRQQLVNIAARGAEMIEMDGYTVPSINSCVLHNEISECFSDNHPFVVMWYDAGDMLRYSLRSKKIDVSEIAKKRGGGGHPGAAGFVVKK